LEVDDAGRERVVFGMEDRDGRCAPKRVVESRLKVGVHAADLGAGGDRSMRLVGEMRSMICIGPPQRGQVQKECWV
jgi:hypothetical protein